MRADEISEGEVGMTQHGERHRAWGENGGTGKGARVLLTEKSITLSRK